MKYKIIITAGGTSERIDNVRKITNSSSGKLGCTIANKLIELHEEKIDKIYYICSKNSIKPNHERIEIVEILDTQDLEIAVRNLLIYNDINYFIHSMAVSDYTVDYVTTAESLALNINNNPDKNVLDLICSNKDNLTDSKISSNQENLIIKLKKTPKIISLIKDISPNTYLVGFKLLDNVSEQNLIDTAVKLKEKNNCNLVVANDLENIRKGNHKAFIIRTSDDYVIASCKEDIAEKIVGEMIEND
ncbi:MAG: phosphopantothenate--cysteine ligase [Bacilli bacterium]|nr:phosphopantothenate--cysteine ligase [Bacilli bacterium]